MENNFDNRDFEQFVKQNADQYRMFPSEKVWNGIHSTLHTRRKWYGIGLALLLLTAGTVTWVMLNNSGKNTPISYKPATTTPPIDLSAQKDKTPGVIIAATRPAKNNTHFSTTADKLQNSLFLPDQASSPASGNNEDENVTLSALPGIKDPVVSVSPVVSIHPETSAKTTPVFNKQQVKSATIAIVSPVKNNDPVLTEDKKAEVVTGGISFIDEKKDIYPLTIESVVNSYKHQRTGKKLSWEVFFTPTVSYRKLNENKDFINAAAGNSNPAGYTSVANINNLVTHKPDMGLQLGFNAGYPLTKSLRIIGGLQFNVSKYDIRAFFSSSEVATIALNTGTGANSVSTVTNYRNFSGSKADWLRNLYFSVSAPVGLELKLTGNSKTQVGISGTVQPTLILSDRAYLISTDYKNYAEVPSLTRKWNVSTGFEIYAGYSTGKLKWRIGPEVRYQLRSSFQEQYPIKEHLFDIGLKVGIMLKK